MTSRGGTRQLNVTEYTKMSPKAGGPKAKTFHSRKKLNESLKKCVLMWAPSACVEVITAHLRCPDHAHRAMTKPKGGEEMESFRVRKSSWLLLCVESHCTSSFPPSTLSRHFPELSRKQTPPLIWLAETAEGDVLNTMIKKNPELSHSPLCALTGIGRRVGSTDDDARAAGIRASLLRAVNEHSEEIKMKRGGVGRLGLLPFKDPGFLISLVTCTKAK